jgi:hypothetical protein
MEQPRQEKGARDTVGDLTDITWYRDTEVGGNQVQKKMIVVDLMDWVLHLRKQLSKKKTSATRLKGCRRIVLRIDPCPTPLVKALCRLISIETSEFVESRNRKQYTWHSQDPDRLVGLFGASWYSMVVLTDGVDDGTLSLKTSIAAPILCKWNKDTKDLIITLLFELKNKEGVIVS